jgi:hypothetical protein
LFRFGSLHAGSLRKPALASVGLVTLSLIC